MGIPTRFSAGPASGQHTAAPTANRLGVYMYAGGGGGAGYQLPGPASGRGGNGGCGFYNKPITQPFVQPFAVGAGGNAGLVSGVGGAGGATTFTNVGTVNGGGGGPNAVSPGAPGTAPGVSFAYPSDARSFVVGTNPGVLYGTGGNKGFIAMCTTANGPAGGPGLIVVFENTGT